jgi:hypothetical protein
VIDWSSCPVVERKPGKVSGSRIERAIEAVVQAIERAAAGTCTDLEIP